MMETVTRILDTERIGNTLVVLPLVNLAEIDYPRIEREAAGVLRLFELTQIKNVVLDLRHADFTGSTAIGFFVKLWKHAQHRGGGLAICHASPHERQILKVCHLDKVWPICDSRKAALAAARGEQVNDQVSQT
jgi:anti-anti-sigma factor